MDEWTFGRWRRIRYLATCLDQLSCTRGLGFRFVIERRNRFTGNDPIPNLFVQHDAHGRIDQIFFALTSAPEDDAGGSNLFALHRGEPSGP